MRQRSIPEDIIGFVLDEGIPKKGGCHKVVLTKKMLYILQNEKKYLKKILVRIEKYLPIVVVHDSGHVITAYRLK